MVLSNQNVGVMRMQVRTNALASFEYFANTVMASRLSEDLCRAVQEAWEDRDESPLMSFHTTRPRALGVALHAWLGSKSVGVLCTADLPQHEILAWLELGRSAKHEESCVLEIHPTRVELRWM